MKRIVEMLGIGDTGVLSGQCTISPMFSGDVALTLLGCQKETQYNDYLQMRDSDGAAMACATSAGAIYAVSMVTPTLTPTTVNAGTLTFTSTISGDGTIVQADVQTVNGAATTARTTRTVGACGVVATTEMTAVQIAVPASSTVVLEVYLSSFCTSGAAAGSADGAYIRAVCSSAGAYVSASTTLLTSNPDTAFAPAIKTGTAYVGVALAGSAGHLYKVNYDVTAVSIA